MSTARADPGREVPLTVRRALRLALADLPAGTTVLLAASGGPDSWALAYTAATQHDLRGLRFGLVTVDHGLQPGSAEHARGVAARAAGLGLAPVEVAHVRAAALGAGPEGAARAARYEALNEAASRHDAGAVLLAHTLDDQAESVLLGLARGSGPRSLSGMRPINGGFRRPFLHLDRDTVHAAIPEGWPRWHDPHNADDAYARARVRQRVLPTLERELGPGVAAALARTADLFRADTEALDAWAERACEQAQVERDEHASLDVATLLDLPTAVRTRVLRAQALRAGCPATELTAGHIAEIDRLLTDWRGQRGVDLPGPVWAARAAGRLSMDRPSS
ncbi:MAG TPA: tRNA lysidine(34) synthetase TilS [Jiangellaceae bacterium]|nr:tRNA lysidine(34) synthetase TilS [Jiangellaceae bacterium]